MNRLLGWSAAVLFLAGVCWLFPLVHIVPLERATKQKAAAAFDPARFADQFWNERLIKSLDKAVRADTLLPAIRSDAAEARKKFSRRLGMSESYTYFVSGEGRVVAVTGDEILLALSASTTEPEIALQTGLLFGNAVRDGTGLLDVNDYPNSQDFNAISEALNHLIETRVLQKLHEQAKAGVTIRFVGCAEVTDESTDLKPLKLIPIQASIE